MVWNRGAKTQVCAESEIFFFSEGLSKAHSRKGAASLQDCDMEHFIWVGPFTAVRERYGFSVWGTRGTLDRPLICPANPASQWGCVVTCLWCVITIRVCRTACHLSAFQMFWWNVEACLHSPVEMISAVSVRFPIWNKSLPLQPCKSSHTPSWEWPLGGKRKLALPTTAEGGSLSLMSKAPVFRALTKVLAPRVCVRRASSHHWKIGSLSRL